MYYSLRSRSITPNASNIRKKGVKRPRTTEILYPTKKQFDNNQATDKFTTDPATSPDLSKFAYSKSKVIDPCDQSVKTTSLWSPKQWRQQLENIKLMRASRDAPVDKIGASKLADPFTTPEVRRYQVLISLMLSSQTKDEVTASAMTRLKHHGLDIENINLTPQNDIEELIKPVGFYRRKAGYIKKASQLLYDKFNNDIPQTLEGIMSLPGVGPKMAHLCMDIAWDNVTGIGVDTHVHRISNRLSWTKKATKDPEETRKALEQWLPREEWSNINWLLVGFGQQICLPINPKCSTCHNKKMCSFASKTIK